MKEDDDDLGFRLHMVVSNIVVVDRRQDPALFWASKVGRWLCRELGLWKSKVGILAWEETMCVAAM